jgi:hypothetical protein
MDCTCIGREWGIEKLGQNIRKTSNKIPREILRVEGKTESKCILDKYPIIIYTIYTTIYFHTLITS